MMRTTRRSTSSNQSMVWLRSVDECSLPGDGENLRGGAASVNYETIGAVSRLGRKPVRPRLGVKETLRFDQP